MLVSFSVENLFSFKGRQTLRMDAVSHGRDDINPQNVFIPLGIHNEKLLKSALVFGANASGKSNFIKTLIVFRDIVLRSHTVLEESESPTRRAIPYLLSQSTLQMPSMMEVVFYVDNVRYRYGLEVKTGIIQGEWLFYTPETRETLLFNREGTSLDYNKSGFPEAGSFVMNGKIQKTRESVPFVSVLAVHNGQHASNVINWFNRLRVADGVFDVNYAGITINLLQQNPQFKSWVLGILNEFEIFDLNVIEMNIPDMSLGKAEGSDELKKVASAIGELTKGKKVVRLNVTKKLDDVSTDSRIEFPLEFESEGTRKLIHLLGPIYNSIINKQILLIDEVEAKFHSLLTRFIFKIYHQENTTGGQIIAAAHDTSLMDTRYFRRDQIWFVNKNQTDGSQLYSLVEFKEKARQLKEQYGPDYLVGAFGAVPLFESFQQIDKVMTDD